MPAQNPYNFLIKQVHVNKTAIIGIAIAIVIAGIVGIYAVSTQDDSSSEAGVGLGDDAKATIKQEDTKEGQPSPEEPIGIRDKAVGTTEEPDEEPPDRVEVIVREGFGMGD